MIACGVEGSQLPIIPTRAHTISSSWSVNQVVGTNCESDGKRWQRESGQNVPP